MKRKGRGEIVKRPGRLMKLKGKRLATTTKQYIPIYGKTQGGSRQQRHLPTHPLTLNTQHSTLFRVPLFYLFHLSIIVSLRAKEKLFPQFMDHFLSFRILIRISYSRIGIPTYTSPTCIFPPHLTPTFSFSFLFFSFFF